MRRLSGITIPPANLPPQTGRSTEARRTCTVTRLFPALRMRIFVSSLFAAALCCAVSFAQESSPAPGSDASHAVKSAGAKPVAKAAESADANSPKPVVKRAVLVKAAAATPAATASSEHKPGFFERVFHGKPAPAPAGSATLLNPETAAATPHPHGKPRKPAGENEEATKSEETKKEAKPPEGAAETGKAPAPDQAGSTEPPDTKTPPEHQEAEAKPVPPAPGKRGRNKKGAPVAEAKPKDAGKELTKEQTAVEQAIAGGNPDVIEKAKYDEVKSRAVEDPHIKELKQKADEASTEAEGRKDLQEYYKTLFKKMRSLGDESVQERIGQMEKAVLKDLGE
jgi:hypothetical protein